MPSVRKSGGLPRRRVYIGHRDGSATIKPPHREINLKTRKDSIEGLGTRINDASRRLETPYEYRREFAPHLDVTYRGKYSTTADYARARGEKPDETRVSVGIRWLF